MKLHYLITLVFLMVASSAPSSRAANPEHVQQLLSTNRCFACDLQGSNLQGAHLIGADLRNADLRGATLSHANLEGADLTGARLNGANLTGVYLTNASLNHTDLTDVNFTKARIFDTEAQGAVIKNINLTDAQIHESPISVGGDDGTLR
jgi:uncharacterized protein YjbI with pentapeptide repeats